MILSSFRFASFLKFIHSIEFFILIILLSTILFYFPLFLSVSSSSSFSSLKSPEDFSGHNRALQIASATIGISIPFLIESILDINLPREITLSRWMSILGLIGPNFLVLMYQNPIVYICSGLARASILVGSLMLHMFNDIELFTPIRKRIYLYSYLSMVVCFQYRLYRVCFTKSLFLQRIDPICGPILVFLGLLGLLLFIWTVGWMIIVDQKYDGGNKYCIYYSIGGVFAVIVFTTYAIAIYGQGKEGTYLAGYNLAATLCVDAVISTFATIIPARMARKERDHAQVSKNNINNTNMVNNEINNNSNILFLFFFISFFLCEIVFI